MATILPKRSSTGGAVPSTDDLAEFEIAVNYADQKIYGRSGDVIIELAGGGGGGGGSGDSGTYNEFLSGYATGGDAPTGSIYSTDVNLSSTILSSSPTNELGEVSIQYGIDTEDLYIYDGASWVKYEND